MSRHVLALAVIFSGCATSLSTFSPAHVAPRRGVQAEMGMDLAIPTGTVIKSIDASRTLAKAADSRMLTESEQRTLFDTGVNLAISPPAPVQHLGLAYGLTDRLEVGLRYTYKAWRLGVRYQIWDQATDGKDFSIGLGLQRFVFDFPVNKIVDRIRLDEFTRLNIDVPILFGKHTDFYRVWGGPRLVFSRFSTALRLDLPPVAGMAPSTVLASAKGSGLYAGAQGGLALGYKKIFIGLELTVVRFFGNARLSLADQSNDVDLDTWVIYPGLALMGEF